MTALTAAPRLKPAARRADFAELRKVLSGQAPSRFTLFEFFRNEALDRAIAGDDWNPQDFSDPDLAYLVPRVASYYHSGYDYLTLHASTFGFPKQARAHSASVSMSHGGLITDRASFEQYAWPAPEAFPMDRLAKVAPHLRDGMKLIVFGPGGVLENVIALVGYEELCFLILDEPALAQEIFDHVGSRLLRYYQLALQYDAVGAIISNDDWGFNTQTMLSPDDMRRYVFPWHQRIVAAAHAAGRPAILHSCGYMQQIWNDVIDGMGFDAKHSYEDNIQPVEQAYEQVQGRIAVLGGIDLDYVCRRSPDEVYRRCRAMLEQAKERGGYALGTGNSIPDYVPWENYFAMVRAALEA